MKGLKVRKVNYIGSLFLLPEPAIFWFGFAAPVQSTCKQK